MKKILFLASFLLFVQFSSFSQGSWQRINVPTVQYLKSVCFVDSLYGWIAGDSGIILHTTNGGITWTAQDTHATHPVEDVFFLNRNEGWASTVNFTTPPFGTILLKTANGGASWATQLYPTENIFITCILYRDSQNGWMGGTPHALVKTTDGGVTWTQAAIDTSTLAFFPVLSIQFYNSQYGYASGGMFDIAGVVWRTSNGGDKWYAIDPSQAPADEVHGLHIFDSIHVMGAGGDPDFGYGVGMIRTSDGGVNWMYDELSIQGNAYDLDFRNDSEVWAPLGPRRLMIYSLDGGVTWDQVTPPDNAAIYDVTFPDDRHGFAVGRDGSSLNIYHRSFRRLTLSIQRQMAISCRRIFPTRHPHVQKSKSLYLPVEDYRIRLLRPLQEYFSLRFSTSTARKLPVSSTNPCHPGNMKQRSMQHN
jgi:photosystem II stability/assembly factor-like uncharacterized protein